MLCVVSSTSNSPKCYIACILPSTKKSGKIGFRSHQRLRREIWCNCGAFAPYFFGFSPCSLQSITQKSIEHRIGCNCGAFAPYFFGFFLSLPVDAGVEPAETVFKGVELMHITLNSPGLQRCMWLFHVHGSG